MELTISKNGIRNCFKYTYPLSFVYLIVRNIWLYIANIRFSDEKYLKRNFLKLQGYTLNMNNPETLNEKLQWMKLHDRKDYHSVFADKFAVREFISKTFGEEFLIPLFFETTDFRDITPENVNNFPCVIKTNHGFGNTILIRDKNEIDWKKTRLDFKCWLSTNYYYFDREWQYNNIKPRILVEKMLICKNGKVPNDYKLNFIQGNLEFIYVSVDREGTNKRNIYDSKWNPMPFTWARKGKVLSNLRGNEIQPPPTLQKMIEYGSTIAKLYKYVRVDFYDVDGVLYFGEITQCHGGGFDQIKPFTYDLELGKKLQL
jgi:hypothetical protein